MSTELPPPTAVPNCSCGHKEPNNIICPYIPLQSCGGPAHCGYCRGGNPPTTPLPPPTPIEPLAINVDALGTWRGVAIEDEGDAGTLPETDQ